MMQSHEAFKQEVIQILLFIILPMYLGVFVYGWKNSKPAPKHLRHTRSHYKKGKTQ